MYVLSNFIISQIIFWNDPVTGKTGHMHLFVNCHLCLHTHSQCFDILINVIYNYISKTWKLWLAGEIVRANLIHTGRI